MQGKKEFFVRKARRIVIKIGSSVLTGDTRGLDVHMVKMITSDIDELLSAGKEVVLVTSGAVAAGIGKLSLEIRPTNISRRQAVAAVGQSKLMWYYSRELDKKGRIAGQILLTRDDFADRRRYLNAKNTIMSLLDYGVIPIINENDSISVDELRFGDNDILSALVSNLVEAELLLILSETEGLYSSDPIQKNHHELISYVEDITPAIEKMAGPSQSETGSGGMLSKLQAAKVATAAGIPVYLVRGKTPNIIKDTISCINTSGTFFFPSRSRLKSRKHWLAYAMVPKGEIVVDDGAMRAIVNRGKSLLPSGILAVRGSFDVGNAVGCLSVEGKEFARGIVNFSGEEVKAICGMKSSEVKEKLGEDISEEVIHRNNLVIL